MSIQEPALPLDQLSAPDAEVMRAPVRRPLDIFIIHPSPLLTDIEPHGDGLLAFRYICELAARGHHIAVACEKTSIKRELPSNIELFAIELKTSNELLRRIEYAAKMRRIFSRLNRTRRFDIAHQLNPVYAGLSIGLAGYRVPVVLGPYVRNWAYDRASTPINIASHLLSVVQQRLATAAILSGPAARERILVNAKAKLTTHTIPYGIDLHTFSQQPLPEGDPVVLYLAGLTRRKGIFVLLNAFEALAKSKPNVQLLIAGSGPDASEAHAAASASIYRDRITFLGKVPRAEVPVLLRRASLVCAPSIGEPYGMAIVEAMATGRPIVATRCGGPVDLVHAEGGILVPPEDPHALALALEDILESPTRAAAMGNFNRGVAETFSWPVVMDQLERVYDSVARVAVERSLQSNGRTHVQALERRR